MILDKTDLEKALGKINREELVQLTMDLVNIPSHTGSEKQIAEFMLDWFQRNGLDTVRQEIEDNRLNAVGILKGTGQGLSLMFNGHLDTSLTGTADDLLLKRYIEPDSLPQATIRDNCVCGIGSGNMKGGIASFMIAAKAIKQSGLKLKGDLILAGVAGEIGKAPIGPHQAAAYRSKGVGTRYLITHGVRSDYAIVADGSGMGLTWVQAGVVYLKITVYGQNVYTPFTKRSPSRKESQNAIIKMLDVIDALETWGADYEKRNTREYESGTVIPKVCIGCIEAGRPFKPSNSPGVCNLYVDVRTLPGKEPLEIKREVEQLINPLGVGAEMEMYISQKGYEGKGVEKLVKAVEEAHVFLFGKKPRRAPTGANSVWTDTNLYNESGIPAVKYGPSRKAEGETGGEMVDIDDLVHAAKLYTIAALEVCNTEKC
ncbi:MAG: dimer protein [Dehalococcoidia bacterium]|nr:dimer protein [Dehalococcoidia bacterium]